MAIFVPICIIRNTFYRKYLFINQSQDCKGTYGFDDYSMQINANLLQLESKCTFLCIKQILKLKVVHISLHAILTLMKQTAFVCQNSSLGLNFLT